MMTNDGEEAIAARAYELWTESNYPHGHDKEHWRQAELELGGVSPCESITGVDRRHSDTLHEASAPDGKPKILHRVPDRGPGGRSGKRIDELGIST